MATSRRAARISPTPSWCSPARAARRSATSATTPTPARDAFATPLAQAQLGAALALAGDQPRADAMFRRAGLAAAGGRARAALPQPTTAAARATPPACSRSPPRPAATRSTAQALTGIVTAPGVERSTQEQLWTLLAAHALAGRRGARLAAASTTRPRPARRCASTPADLPAPRDQHRAPSRRSPSSPPSACRPSPSRRRATATASSGSS